jgi:hypothetical protein
MPRESGQNIQVNSQKASIAMILNPKKIFTLFAGVFVTLIVLLYYKINYSLGSNILAYYAACSFVASASCFLGAKGWLIPATTSLLMTHIVFEGEESSRIFYPMSLGIHIVACVSYIAILSEDDERSVPDSMPVLCCGLCVLGLMPISNFFSVSFSQSLLHFSGAALAGLAILLTRGWTKAILLTTSLVYCAGLLFRFSTRPYDLLLATFCFVVAMSIDIKKPRFIAKNTYVCIGITIVLSQLFTQNASWLGRCFIHFTTLRYCAV